MSIYKDVTTTEMELFNILVMAFTYSENRQFAKLKICLEALFELEKDYKEMTHTTFIKTENVERLLIELEKLEKNNNGPIYQP